MPRTSSSACAHWGVTLCTSAVSLECSGAARSASARPMDRGRWKEFFGGSEEKGVLPGRNQLHSILSGTRPAALQGKTTPLQGDNPRGSEPGTPIRSSETAVWEESRRDSEA